MDERIIQFRVGVVVIAAFLIAATLTLWFGEGLRGTYTIYLQYSSAPGVSVDTPVRKSGIRIGRVNKVELLDDGVLLTLKIDDGRVLKNSETPRLMTASILGDTVVEFVPKDARDMPAEIRLIEDGETLAGGPVSSGPAEVFQLVAKMEHRIDAALRSIEDAGTKVAELSEGVTSVVGQNDQRLASILEKSDVALSHFSRVMENVNGVIGDDQRKNQLRQTIQQLPALFLQARQTLADAQTTFANVQRVSQSAERNLQNLQGLTEPLGEQGDELVETIRRSVGNVEELVTQLVMFSQALNRSDGSLSQLVHDRELHDRLNRTASNVEELSRKLVPIMNDARVLADKLARDPSQLGLRGAIARQRSGDGLKYPYLSDGSWNATRR